MICHRYSVRKTTLGKVGERKNGRGFNITRIKLDDAPEHRDRLIPMRESSLDQTDRSQHIDIVGKTFLRELEFQKCSVEIARPVKAVITKRKMGFSEVRIERNGVINGILRCGQPRRS